MSVSSVAESFMILRHRRGRKGQPQLLVDLPASVLNRAVFQVSRYFCQDLKDVTMAG